MRTAGLQSNRLVLLSYVFAVLPACSSHESFAESATASLATATSNINEAFGESDGDHRHHLVSGDFTGDGYLDNAYASVISEDNWSLVVHSDVLNDDGGEIFVLDEHTPSVPVSEVRLEVMPPGEFETSCGRIGQCDAGELDAITMPSDGVYLVIIEASASLIYWDPKSESFVRHWLTD